MVWPLYDSFQQVPQLAEFQPATAWTPPMYGKRGIWPWVDQWYLVSRPLGPSEQETTLREREPSS